MIISTGTCIYGQYPQPYATTNARYSPGQAWLKARSQAKALHEKTLNIICTEVIDEPGSQFQKVGGKLQRTFCLENFAIELTKGKLLHNAREHQTKSSKCDKKPMITTMFKKGETGVPSQWQPTLQPMHPLKGGRTRSHERLKKLEMNVMIYDWYWGGGFLKEIGLYLPW